jgi:hypothetical protein
MNERAMTLRGPEPDLDVFKLGSVLAKSGYFTDTREEAQAIVKVLYGREVGVGPIAAMMGINIIKGRPAVSAGLMASIIKASRRYTYRIRTHTAERCDIEFFEGSESLGVSSFTKQDAEAAGLTGNTNYKNYPRNMLFARALSNGARWHCPDIFNGSVYTPDELDERIEVDEDGAIVQAPQQPAPIRAMTETAVNPPKQMVTVAATQRDPNGPITKGQIEQIEAAGKDAGYTTRESLQEAAKEVYDGRTIGKLTYAEAEQFLRDLQSLTPAPTDEGPEPVDEHAGI